MNPVEARLVNRMPTPFYHLKISDDLLAHPALDAQVRAFLLDHRPAFMLGNTAPDVQTVSGQAREATHFFDLPIQRGDTPAWEQMFFAHASLSHPQQLAPSQAAFLAGFICHLQADWLWILQIFAPVFGPAQSWASFRQRLYLHNVLRAYLDRQILPGLNAQTAGLLSQAAPSRWLPFVEDRYLVGWRDFLAQQLHPGSAAQTVEVFAARQGISPEAFYRLMDSEEALDQQVFNHLPRPALDDYRLTLLEENIRLLHSYWFG